MTMNSALTQLGKPTIPTYSRIQLKKEIGMIDDEIFNHKQQIAYLEEKKRQIRIRLERIYG